MNIKKLISDILTNPDNISYSAKRVGGYISLIATIVFGAFKIFEAMTIMAALTGTFFGLTSFDNSTATKSGQVDGKNP